MWSDFARQSRRLELIRGYRMILTASEHMRSEYIRHGFSPATVRAIALPVTATPQPGPSDDRGSRDSSPASPWRLLFVGRMEPLKGADLLLDALAPAAKMLQAPLRLTLAGDGRERARLEARAAHLCSRDSRIEIGFTGWLDQERLADEYRVADLIVMPSRWPEPFGLAGIEAASFSVPAAAFAVGGIPEWLKEGVNGHLAPGDAPNAAALAKAIAKCLNDRQHYAQLRAGALAIAKRYTLANHLRELLGLFETLVKPGSDHRPSAMPLTA